MISKNFLGNKKGLVGISVIIFLVLVFWGIQVPKAEAVDYSYLHIKIDSFGTTALWQFHGFNAYPHNISGDGLYGIGSAPSGYQCALWLVEEFSLTSDVVTVVWTKTGNRLQRNGTSISSDLTDKTYVGSLCSTVYIDSDPITGTLVCDDNEPLWDIPTQTAIFPYGAVDALGGGEDRTLSDSIVNTYRPDVDILCAGPNLWKTCEANDCATIGANQWACNGGTGVWTNCTAIGQVCAAGVCTFGLKLNIAASPNPVNANATSVVTFTVKNKNTGAAVSGAQVTVAPLTDCTGGLLPSPVSLTDAAGQTQSIFTAPATTSVCIVTATATKAGFTDGTATYSIYIPGPCEGGLVPCGRGCDDPNTTWNEMKPCQLCHFFLMLDMAVDFLLKYLVFPLAVLLLVIGGLLYLTAGGDPGIIGTAHRIITSVILGLFIILAAWVIISIFLQMIGLYEWTGLIDDPLTPEEEGWWKIKCPM